MLHIVGDVNLTDHVFDVGFGVGSSLVKGRNPFEYIQKETTDVWIGNFEGVTSEVSDLNGFFRKCFNVKPDFLNATLIDYWGVANNHVMEHGEKAYKETLENLSLISKGFFGSLEQHSVFFDLNDKKIAISAFSLRVDGTHFISGYWCNPNYEEIQKEIERIAYADIKIVYIHWGCEFITYPYEGQKRFARWLIDAGYDLVIGMHPHIMQGFEVYKDKYIFYSLGNFVFNMPWEPLRYGLIVSLNEQTFEVSYRYVHIDSHYAPHIIDEAQVPANLQLPNLNMLLKKKMNIENYIIEQQKGLAVYRKSNYRYILRHIFCYKYVDVCSMVMDFLKRRIKK